MSPEAKRLLDDCWDSQSPETKKKARFRSNLKLDAYMSAFGRGLKVAEAEDAKVAIKIFERQLIIRRVCFTICGPAEGVIAKRQAVIPANGIFTSVRIMVTAYGAQTDLVKPRRFRGSYAAKFLGRFDFGNHELAVRDVRGLQRSWIIERNCLGNRRLSWRCILDKAGSR